MSLKELISLQAERDLGEYHLIEVHETTFNLAHTDLERERGENTEACEYHQWACNLKGPPAPLGVYIIVPRATDTDPETYHHLIKVEGK